jgi:hypothetical protein
MNEVVGSQPGRPSADVFTSHAAFNAVTLTRLNRLWPDPVGGWRLTTVASSYAMLEM